MKIIIKSIIINNRFATDFIIGDVNHGRYLQISQLAVYAIVNGVRTNVALSPRGTATASSTYGTGFSASNAIDGVLQALPNKFHSQSMSSTTTGETWTLTLDAIYNIDSIVLITLHLQVSIR